MSEELIKRLRKRGDWFTANEYLESGSLMREAADALSRAPAVQVPEGMALVPMTLTRDMVAYAVDSAFDGALEDASVINDIWVALLAAAPTPATVATEAVAQVLRKGIRLEPSDLRAMMEWAGIGDDYDEDDAAPLLLWIGEMKDEEGSATYGLNASNEEVPDEGCWLVKELPRPEVNADKPEQAEDALRSLACWLSVGGYNSEEVDAAEFEKRIREGIETIVRVEVERAKKAVAQGGMADIIERMAAHMENYSNEPPIPWGLKGFRFINEARALLASPAVPAGDGWIAWGGGECPVPKGTLVDVRHRDGEEQCAVRAGIADDYYAEEWSITNSDPQDGDIIAYRLHGAAPSVDGEG